MSEVFCMHCFAQLAAVSVNCPLCHHPVDDIEDGDYQRKLIDALHHQHADIRMRAIVAIGIRRDKHAADALVACALRNPSDLAEGMQIVAALKVIDDGKPRVTALHYLFARHPSNEIKQATHAILNDLVDAR